MNIEIDITAKALYLRLAHGHVTDTVELGDAVVADMDESGAILGIEFVRVNRFAPFIAAHPDLVTLPAHLTYTSVDRAKTWQTEIRDPAQGRNGTHLSQIAELNGTFVMDLVADPARVDRIVDGETITLHPTISRN